MEVVNKRVMIGRIIAFSLLFLVMGFIISSPLQAVIAPGTLEEYQRNKNMYQPPITTPTATPDLNAPVTQKEFQEFKSNTDKFMKGQVVINETTTAMIKHQQEVNESIANAIEALQRTDEAIYRVLLTLD